jgi:hypothetical protein
MSGTLSGKCFALSLVRARPVSRGVSLHMCQYRALSNVRVRFGSGTQTGTLYAADPHRLTVDADADPSSWPKGCTSRAARCFATTGVSCANELVPAPGSTDCLPESGESTEVLRLVAVTSTLASERKAGTNAAIAPR